LPLFYCICYEKKTQGAGKTHKTGAVLDIGSSACHIVLSSRTRPQDIISTLGCAKLIVNGHLEIQRALG
jgi:hypothetical protein